MPIPSDLISRNLVPRLLVPADTVATLLYLFADHAQPRRCFAVVYAGSTAVDVLALDDLVEPMTRFGAALLTMPLAAVPGLLRFGAPVVQAQVGEDRATREMAARHRSRLVVLDDTGAVLGVMASTPLGVPKGPWPLALIGLDEHGGVLGPEAMSPPIAPPQLLVRLDGVPPQAPVTVGRRVPLVVSVGAPAAAFASKPFPFNFAAATEPVRFQVSVEADEERWQVRVLEPILIVSPPGTTTQEAEFLLSAKLPGRDRLLVRVVQEASGAPVQNLWLTIDAVAEAPAPRTPLPAPPPVIQSGFALDTPNLAHPTVELFIEPDLQGSIVRLLANLPSGMRRQTVRLPVSSEAIQTATLRLRDALQQIVYFRPHAAAGHIYQQMITIPEDVARQACVPLAEAGKLVWDTLFHAPRGDELRAIAEEIRTLPLGSHLRVTLASQECIIPWALLYDRPGSIDAQSLDWDGFWGSRLVLDVLPLGQYPAPTIAAAPPALLVLFNDDANLRSFTTAQEQYVRQQIPALQLDVAWGHEQVVQTLRNPPLVALVYSYCHGLHRSGAIQPTRFNLANESALYFSAERGLRVVDLRDLPVPPLASRPLIFVNACEGATQDAFYYDGFMPFFIEQQLARGFIGTEVKTPSALAHALGLTFLERFAAGHPVGQILWHLRRDYLQQHQNILAFNYSLYCPADTRLLVRET